MTDYTGHDDGSVVISALTSAAMIVVEGLALNALPTDRATVAGAELRLAEMKSLIMRLEAGETLHVTLPEFVPHAPTPDPYNQEWTP